MRLIDNFYLQGTQIMTPGRTPGMMTTPGHGGPMPAGTPGATPIRDKLSINEETALVPADDRHSLKLYQKAIRDELQAGLGKLPVPRNDFQIVVPEDEQPVENDEEPKLTSEDQADVDARYYSKLKN